MPASFESFGIKFLYPDNWTVTDREEHADQDGVTLELPSGGFFTLEREHEGQLAEELIEEVADSLQEDYGDVEREEIQLDNASAGEKAVDFRFYYLDLLIISRLVIVHLDNATYVIQMQAESRDFDANERVFAALMNQIRG
jgi:hypothetical protein